MDSFHDNSLLLRRELESLPRDYTEAMAKMNRDIVTNGINTFNIGRYLIFIDNYYKGIPDKIRITSYGIDSPPSVKIVLYDGNMVTFVIDGTRYPSKQFYIYYGYEIIVNRRSFQEDAIIDCDLKTVDQRSIPIIHIWAGCHPLSEYEYKQA